jgi:hypothetical protein
MPPPKDPEKYTLYIKRQSESHRGHKSSRLGKTHTPETIKLMKEAKKGKYDGEKNPFYNKKHTSDSINLMKTYANNRPPAHNEKISKSMVGRVPWNLGIPCSEPTRKKLSESQKGEKSVWFGKTRPESTRQLIRDFRTRITVPEITCKRISLAKQGLWSKEKNPNWNGGTSFFPYCYKFNERRKRAVRNFFNNLCICCGRHVTENIVKYFGQINLPVHHIDHDKDQGCNGRPFNLVPLCNECHIKELYNQEDFKTYINKTLDEGFRWGIWSKEEYEIKVMYPEDIPDPQLYLPVLKPSPNNS